jgi:hypothetical protein
MENENQPVTTGNWFEQNGIGSGAPAPESQPAAAPTQKAQPAQPAGNWFEQNGIGVTQNAPQPAEAAPQAAAAPAQPETGVVAGIKRNTIGAVTGIYHALTDPVTPEESAQLLQKIRDHNQRPDVQKGFMPAIPEESAQNPSKVALAYHRIIDAPADELLKKGKDETEAAKDLLAHHEYWKGGNLYMSGLTDRLLSAVPLVGPAINQTAERAERGDVSGAAADVAAALMAEKAPEVVGKYGGKAINAARRATGTGGLTPVESLAKAGRPSVYEREFTANAERALPRLVEENKISPIKTPDDLSNAAYEAANKLWEDEVKPQIQRHANETIPGKPAADAIRSGVDAGTSDLFPEEAQKAEEFAKKFDGDMTLEQASDRLQALNARLKRFYKLDPSARYAAGMNDSQLAAMETAADSLRDGIYGKLESLGEQNPRELRQQYGALKQMERVFEKRAVVHGRQAPLNLHDVIGAVGAVASHNPVVAGIPILAKYLNKPETLIKGAISDAGKTAATPNAPSTAGATARVATGLAGRKEEENQEEQ